VSLPAAAAATATATAATTTTTTTTTTTEELVVSSHCFTCELAQRGPLLATADP